MTHVLAVSCGPFATRCGMSHDPAVTRCDECHETALWCVCVTSPLPQEAPSMTDYGHMPCCDCTPEALGDHCEAHFEDRASGDPEMTCGGYPVASPLAALSDADLSRMRDNAWTIAVRCWQDYRASSKGQAQVRSLLLAEANEAESYWHGLSAESKRRDVMRQEHSTHVDQDHWFTCDLCDDEAGEPEATGDFTPGYDPSGDEPKPLLPAASRPLTEQQVEAMYEGRMSHVCDDFRLPDGDCERCWLLSK